MLEQITKDMIDSMKCKDSLKLATLRMLKGAIDLERINKKVDCLTDDDIISIVGKQIKTRKESIVEFEKGNRADLVEKTNNEIEILSAYLPEQLSLDEVKKIIEDAISFTNAKSIKEMGLVMREVSPKLKGKADMSMVSEIIKSKLEA